MGRVAFGSMPSTKDGIDGTGTVASIVGTTTVAGKAASGVSGASPLRFVAGGRGLESADTVARVGGAGTTAG